MRLFDNVQFGNLERRILQLSILASGAILILGAGAVSFMYPAVFGAGAFLPDSVFRNAFYGFCGLSVLLSAYIVERQVTIVRLRRQLAENHMNFTDSQRQATQELLAAMPNLKTFQDRLPDAFRRTVASQERLSVMLVMLQLPGDYALHSEQVEAFGDAAAAATRAIRKLRNEDTVYMLAPSCLAIVLLGVDLDMAEQVSRRVSEGLSYAAGTGYRFYFKIEIVNYPVHGVSAHEIQQAVKATISGETDVHDLAQTVD